MEPSADPAPPRAAIEQFAAWIDQCSRVLFITGAGLSADSGLPTYRGVGGLYDDAVTEDGLEIEDVLSGEMMRRRPALCWRYIHQVEQAGRGAAPNRAHEVIAEIERRRGGVVVLTQNVDGLHHAAGSREVIEMHGNLYALRCTRCSWEQRVIDYSGLQADPRCPACGQSVRPNVVLFGEMLPGPALASLRRQMEQGFSLVVTVGTTAVFPYIAAPVERAPRWGAHTVEVNPGLSTISPLVELRLGARAAPTFDALAAALGYG